MINYSKLYYFIFIIHFSLFIQSKDFLVLEKTLVGHNNKINAVAFSKDNQIIVTGSWDGTIIIWDFDTGKIKYRVGGNNIGETHFVTGVSISNDNKYFVSSSSDHTATIWDINNGEKKSILKGHTDFVMSAEYSDDDSFILTTSYDNSARIWSTDGKLLYVLKHPDNAKYAKIGKDFIVTVCKNIAYLWTKNGILRNQLYFDQTITSLNISNDSKYIITGYNDGTIIAWDSVGNALYTIKPHDNGVLNIFVSPSNKYIISGSTDLYSCIIDITNGQLIKKNYEGMWVNCCKSDPNENLLLSAGNFFNLRDFNTGNLLQRIDSNFFVTDIFFINNCLIFVDYKKLKFYKFYD